MGFLRELLLFFSTPLLTFIFATAFFVIWSRDKRHHENLGLSIGWLLMTCGFSISILSPAEWGRAIPAITLMPFTLAVSAISWGMLTRIGVRPPLKAHLWIAFTGFSAMMFVQNIGNSITADLFITDLTCGAMLVMTAQLFAYSSGRDPVERFLLVMLILAAAQFFIRPVVTLMFDSPLTAQSFRDSTYFFALNWVFAFGSVLFGLAQIAGAVKDYVHSLYRSASRDVLSGLLVRGEFEAQVEAALRRATAEGIEASLVIGDIDFFKQVNDIWGHQAGDIAIAQFGKMAEATIRSSDIAGRIGGDEFCILVWNANEDVASGLAERMRERTAALEIESSNSRQGAFDVRLTASFGVAQQMHGENYMALFAKADSALYASKQSGRDCVSRASPVLSSEQSSAAAPDNSLKTVSEAENFSLNDHLTDLGERYAG